MRTKGIQRFVASVLFAVLLMSQPVQAMAMGDGGFWAALRNVFSTENTSAFTTLEIRKGTLNGEKVVNLLAPDSSWKLAPSQDYYVYAEIKKPEDATHIQIRLGSEENSFNGLTFFNPPGGVYAPGKINHDYFDWLEKYDAIQDPSYGSGINILPLQDGTMTYHIKAEIGANDTITFATGLIMDDGAYGGIENLVNAIQIAVGHMDANTFVADSTKTSDIRMTPKGSMRAAYSSTGATAELDVPGGTLITFIGDEIAGTQVPMLYDKLEWDIYYPVNAVLEDIGFTTGFGKTHTDYGTLSISKPTTESGQQKVHMIIENGYKKKASNLLVYFRFRFPSTYFKAGEQWKIDCKNVTITPKGTESKVDISGVSASAVYTLLSATADYSSLTAMDRPGVYNNTIDTGEPYMVSLGSVRVHNKSISTPTQREKTYEADFNITNTAAAISAITVPLGTSSTPEVTWYGVDAAGNARNGTLTGDLTIYTIRGESVEKSLALRLHADALGIKSFTKVTAKIGSLRKDYSSSAKISSMDLGNNNSGAFGYFTTAETGIQVKNAFRLYNTDPIYRNEENGDLTVTSVATSTAQNKAGFTTSGVTIKDEEGQVIDSIAAGKTVTISGQVLPYSVPAETRKGVMRGASSFVINPVFYLTLPAGLTYEKLSFAMTKQMFNGSVASTQVPIQHQVENVSYLNTTGDGVSIYKVTFPEGSSIGFYDKNGERFALNYAITLCTSKSMETRRYELNKLIGVSAEKPVEAMPYSNNPATLNTVMPDKYGMNGGLDYSGIVKGSEYDQPGFGLQQLAEINIYNSVAVTEINGKPAQSPWQTYDESDPNSIISLGKNSKGQFKLDIQNTSDKESGKLEIIIPVPKINTTLGTAFMKETAEFDMTMDIPEQPLTDAGFQGTYIKISGTYDSCEGDITYAVSDKANANGILLTSNSVAAKANNTFTFDFAVENGTAGATGIWRNVFNYTTSDDVTSYKNGSYVASAIAGSSITGTVFEDGNRNGVQDTEEQGVSGITVVVKDDQNKILSAVTNAAGGYNFQAVRDSALDMRFTIAKSKKLRFNIPVSENPGGSTVIPVSIGLSAGNSFTANNATETVNAAVSGYSVLRYDKNSASATGDLPLEEEYVAGNLATVSVKPDSLLLKGYKFKEWNSTQDGSQTGFQAGQTMTITEDTTLYAIWEIGTYTLRFDYRGATGGNEMTEKELIHSQTYNTGGILPTPVRTGYTFEGWCTTPAGTTAVSNTAKFSLGEDSTLYAMWKVKEGYIVKYNTDEGGSDMADASVAWSDAVLPSEIPTRAGYLFEGWTYKGETVIKGTTFAALADSDAVEIPITLDARWMAKGGYTVQYDGNGGTAISSKTGVSWIDSGLLPEVAPTKANFAFGGWTLGASAQTVTNDHTYGNLAVYDDMQSVTLKAVWNAISDNTVHYDTGGGTVYPDKTSVGAGDNNLLPATAPIRPGYVFIGWMYQGTKSVTLETVYSELNNTPNSAVTITANWKAKTYTIRYSDGNFAEVTKNWSDSGLIGNQIPSKEGNDFDGWYYGGGKVTDSIKISQLMPKDDQTVITLQARWVEHTYTIVYESNGGGTYVPKTDVKYSASGLLPGKAPVRIGYTLAGWFCGGAQVTSGTGCKELAHTAEEKTITLSAVWTEKTGYTVNYNSAGGTEVVAKTNVSWNNGGLLPGTVPSRTGYAFNGWVSGRTAVNAATTYGSLASSDAPGSSITLVAQWKEAGGYTVSYDTGSGVSVPNRNDVTWNMRNLIPLQNVAPPGYTVKGWTCYDKPVTASMTYGELAALAGEKPVVLKAIYESAGGSDNGTDVQGKVIEGEDSAVYKIDISWGPMKFEYSVSNTWNPEEHSYEEKLQGWTLEPFNGINNKIEVSNHSNADVEVDFRAAVEDPEAMEGVTVEVRQQNSLDGEKAENMRLGKVPTENAKAPAMSAYLWMYGIPQNASILEKDEYSKFGIVNVTIRATNSTLTPRNSTP